MSLDDRKIGILSLSVMGTVAAGSIAAMAFFGVSSDVMDKAIPALSAVSTTAVGAVAAVIKGVKGVVSK